MGLRAQNKLGRVFVEMLFSLSTGLSRRPDLAFVANERLVPDSVMQTDPAQYEASPNLAVEVISLTNSMTDVLQKLQEYFTANVQLVWVVVPLQRLIYAYTSPTQVNILAVADELNGDPVLPGFRLALAHLFTL